ncbi:hypothetical protein BRX37_14060 [Sphingomonas sp. S-NIH.Pt3_0716]|nr:hypothetical protein BRX37_14060 [Sphingomonas sp. S-NIH.Pt3_0716]
MVYRPRLTAKTCLVFDAITRRAQTGGAPVLWLIDEFGGDYSRSEINNAITALLKARVIRRSREEPYRYSPQETMGMTSAERQWVREAQLALREMTGADEYQSAANPEVARHVARQEARRKLKTSAGGKAK